MENIVGSFFGRSVCLGSDSCLGSNNNVVGNSNPQSNKPPKRGRQPGLIETKKVIYNTAEYIVMTIKYNNTYIKVVVDADDYNNIENKNWHISSGKYIGYNCVVDGTVKEIYLHNLLMDNTDSNTYVIHINKINFDNRKINLKVVSSEEYSYSKKKRVRKIKLPDDCNILLDELPKYVNYNKASRDHGDRFSIEIPLLNIFWKSSCSKKGR
jgi:hypothetical protein